MLTNRGSKDFRRSIKLSFSTIYNGREALQINCATALVRSLSFLVPSAIIGRSALIISYIRCWPWINNRGLFCLALLTSFFTTNISDSELDIRDDAANGSGPDSNDASSPARASSELLPGWKKVELTFTANISESAQRITIFYTYLHQCTSNA